MSNPLHKAPSALMELFRLRTQGRQPDTVETTVAPVVDVTNMYGADLQFTGNIQSAAAAFPLTIVQPITVGPNRYLAIAGLVQMGAAGGTYLSARLQVRVPNPAAPACMIGSLVVVNPVAGGLYACVGVLAEPLLLLPGCTIECVAQSDAVGADHVASVRQLLQALSTG